MADRDWYNRDKHDREVKRTEILSKNLIRFIDEGVEELSVAYMKKMKKRWIILFKKAIQ